MSSKYDLDKLLDPYGINKFQKTITRITDPFKEYLALNPSMASIADVYENPALEAMKKVSMPFKEYLALNPSMASIAGVYENPALEAMKKVSMPFKEYLALNPSMASIAGVYENPALEAMKKVSMPFKEYLALNPSMASIAGVYENPALEAIRSAASDIAINKSLGLQADVQRLIAAKTLIPGLNTKIFNLNQKLYAIAGLTEQSPNQNNFDSIQNYLETFEEFNEKYHQDINIDRTAIQTLDLVLQQQETLELTSDLRDIGIFDTSSGSILLEYLETLPNNKASLLSRLIVCLLVWFAETVTEPIINEYEPIKNNQKSLVNFLNDVEGLARVIKDCDLKDQPNGLKEMRLEKESIVTLYKTNKDIPDGWSKIKFNKDGHDITGYIKTSELHLLD
ncbi:DUF764 family protein [Acinetobacter sp. ASP199]|uniref:DUF764 family protein n=1 Tax=unclassified Acinetobacter TaxID=196816 RepID=UPI001F60572D|nr:DUF764 family protein [Acinetobacter sp. ASP199]UNT58004.1 DUF764 family protein [Acinetobacter sp. ASP199]